MSLGLGICFSTIFVCFLLLYKWTRDRESWKQGIKKMLKWLLALAFTLLVIVCLIWGVNWVYDKYEKRPVKQTSYYDVHLGMTKNEVEYVMGMPPRAGITLEAMQRIEKRERLPQVKAENSSEDIEVMHLDEFIEDEPVNSEKLRKSYTWLYNDKGIFYIDFDSNSKVEAIHCSHLPSSEDKHAVDYPFVCKSVLSVGVGTTEDEVLRKLGLPQHSKIESGNKTLYYPKLNLKLRLERKLVKSIIVYAAPGAKF